MARKPCMTSVKTAGAHLVKARRMAGALVDQIIIARAAAKAAIPELIGHGAKEMEFGAGLDALMDAARCEGLVGKAHNSFRAALRGCDVAEPSDDDIVVILGGGGGGR